MKLTKFISHYSKLYVILYELYKMRHANASKQKSWLACYCTVLQYRGPSSLEARTVRWWNSRRVPKKVWFCVIVKKCIAGRPVLYHGPSDTVPRTVRRTKADWVPETHRFWVGFGNELRTVRGWRADRPPFNGPENNFLRCFWWFGCASGGPSAGFERTVRKNSETHRRGHRRQVRPRLWSGFVPKGF